MTQFISGNELRHLLLSVGSVASGPLRLFVRLPEDVPMSIDSSSTAPTPNPQSRVEGHSSSATPDAVAARHSRWVNIKDRWEDIWEKFARGLGFVLAICIVGLIIWGAREAWLWVDRRSDQHAAAERLAEAMQLSDQKDFAGALAKQREAIALWPDNSGLHWHLGIILLLKNHHVATPDKAECEAAYESFCTAIRLNPNSVDAHEGAASCRIRLGDPPGALPHLQEAARLNPDSIRIQERLAKLHADESRRQLLLLANILEVNKPTPDLNFYPIPNPLIAPLTTNNEIPQLGDAAYDLDQDVTKLRQWAGNDGPKLAKAKLALVDRLKRYDGTLIESTGRIIQEGSLDDLPFFTRFSPGDDINAKSPIRLPPLENALGIIERDKNGLKKWADWLIDHHGDNDYRKTLYGVGSDHRGEFSPKNPAPNSLLWHYKYAEWKRMERMAK